MVLAMKFSKPIHVAIAAVQQAGARVIQERNGKAWKKKDKSDVTSADLAAHEILTSTLSETGIAVLSEENPVNTLLSKEQIWIVDPLDGTTDFISGSSDFAVMAGLLEDKKPVAGVVFFPAEGRLLVAEKFRKAVVTDASGERPLTVSTHKTLKRCRAVVSKNHPSQSDEAFAETIQIRGVERRGSIGVKLGLIAQGQADLYWNFDGVNCWDLCAPQAILEAAGGHVTDLMGTPITYTRLRFGTGILASNGHIHAEAVQAMTGFKKTNGLKHTR